RLFFPHARDGVIPGRFFTIDDDLGWRMRPERTAVHHTRYFDVEYATDALGYRDTGSTPASPSRYSMLLYGDSLVFGWGIPRGKRFSDLLERDGLRIFNHGVPGYGLDQEVVAYEKETLHADEAWMFVGASTLRRIHTGYLYGKYK